MIDVAPVQVATNGLPRRGPRRWFPRRRWLVVAGVLTLLLAGGVTALMIANRYLDAPALTTDGGGWLPPDNEHPRFVHAGPYTASIASARPGHAQTFELDLINDSSVSQTVLGLTDGKTLADPRMTGEPEHLRISTKSAWPESGGLTYTSHPVTIPPRAVYKLRLTHDTSTRGWRNGDCRTESWTSLSLRVRVGIFTRTEKLDFGSLSLELRGNGRNC
jgi:hypothetical protein